MLVRVYFRIIHDSGFSREEKLMKKFIIYGNLVTGMVDLLKLLEEHGIAFQMAGSEVGIVYPSYVNHFLFHLCLSGISWYDTWICR